MTIPVLLFARARELAGTGRLTVALPEPATVGDLRRRLAEAYPGLAGLLPRCAMAVNETFAQDADALPAGATVAVLPPVSGGQP